MTHHRSFSSLGFRLSRGGSYNIRSSQLIYSIFLIDPSRMDRDRDKMAESILDLTLEILFRLTGEDYTVVKKTSNDHCQAPVSEGWGRTLSPITGPPPHPLILEEINEKKILELTYKMIELLTEEVPIRCQDVTVYFSMEEWEYLEGHKDLYQPLISPDDWTRSSAEHLISSDVKPYDCGITQNDNEVHSIIPDIPSTLHSKDLSSDPVTEESSDLSPTVQQNKCHSSAEHQRPQTGETPFSCSQCGKCFTDKSNLVNHERSHMGEKPFSCSECGKCFSMKGGLATHQRIHTGEKPFSCSQCGKCFTDKSNYVRHERIHTRKKPFSLSEGGKCFTRESLLDHQKTHTGEKPYSCLECGKCFSLKGNLVTHHRIHTGEKPYSCLECGKCFIQKSDLATHKRIHTGEKPFSCSECGKCFFWQRSFVRHQIIHTEGKPFSCSECGKCFTDKSNLVQHQRIHTGEKPFSCSECGKSFNRKANLVTHQRLHTGLKPFSCSQCGKCFKIKSYCVKHERSHTGKK